MQCDALAGAPGYFSDRSAGFACTECRPGYFKSASMATSPICVKKRSTCAKSTHRFFNTTVFGAAESTIMDDTVCLEDSAAAKTCPSGSRVQRSTAPSTTYTCLPCTAGTFSHGPNTASQCSPKSVVRCDAGQHLVSGTSPAHDDNLCVGCPVGMFQPTALPANESAPCKPKAVPRTCQAGEHLVFGKSTTADDNGCASCPQGEFAPRNHSSTVCQKKQIVTCPPGHYFFTKNSVTEDDNECLPCPAGTFSASTSPSGMCRVKTPGFCAAGRSLHAGASAKINDNACVLPGECAPGHRWVPPTNTSAGACAVCAPGEYKEGGGAGTACAVKRAAESCPAGTHLVFGDSITANDARCAPCSAGTFNRWVGQTRCRLKQAHVATCPSGSRATSYDSTTADDSQCRACAAGQYTGENTTSTTCAPKLAPASCPAGEYVQLGSSAKADDWVCATCADGTFAPERNSNRACIRKNQPHGGPGGRRK